ncbi:hypothetical protein AAMO2058_001355900 [Amorphochlora amoebiformis]
MRLYGTFPSGQRRGVGNARTPSLKKNAGQHRAQPASSVGSFGDAREPLPRGSPGDSGEFEGGIDPQNCSSPEGQSGVMRLGVGFRKGLGICARYAGTIAVFVVLVPVFCLASRVWILEFGPHHVRNPVNFDDVLLYPNGKSSPSNPADYLNRDTAPKLHEWEYARHVDPSPPRRTKLFSVGKGAEGHLPSTDTILPQPISSAFDRLIKIISQMKSQVWALGLVMGGVLIGCVWTVGCCFPCLSCLSRLCCQTRPIRRPNPSVKYSRMWAWLDDGGGGGGCDVFETGQTCKTTPPKHERGRAWAALIGNSLVITPELYQICDQLATNACAEHDNLDINFHIRTRQQPTENQQTIRLAKPRPTQTQTNPNPNTNLTRRPQTQNQSYNSATPDGHAQPAGAGEESSDWYMGGGHDLNRDQNHQAKPKDAKNQQKKQWSWEGRVRRKDMLLGSSGTVYDIPQDIPRTYVGRGLFQQGLVKATTTTTSESESEVLEMEVKGSETSPKAAEANLSMANSGAFSSESKPKLDALRTLENHKETEAKSNRGLVTRQRALSHVLRAYCFYRPDIGYMQGMSYVAGHLLMYMDEYTAFVAFANLLSKPFLGAFYMGGSVVREAMESRFALFDHALKTNVPNLYTILKEVDVPIQNYFFQWSLTLYGRVFPFETLARVWHSYLLEGEVYLYRVGVALVSILRPTILTKQKSLICYKLQNPGEMLNEGWPSSCSGRSYRNTDIDMDIDMDRSNPIDEQTLLKHLKPVRILSTVDDQLTRIRAQQMHKSHSKDPWESSEGLATASTIGPSPSANSEKNCKQG